MGNEIHKSTQLTGYSPYKMVFHCEQIMFKIDKQ